MKRMRAISRDAAHVIFENGMACVTFVTDGGAKYFYIAVQHNTNKESCHMKSVLIVFSVWVGVLGAIPAFSADEKMHQMNHRHAMSMMDARTSLGMPAEMKQHQLSNMRSHLEAISSIVALMSESKFDEASAVAHAKLGLTPEMRKMCSMFGNEKFRALGMAFHQSGDDLGDALQSKDVNVSLRALHNTIQYCTECHASYRQ